MTIRPLLVEEAAELAELFARQPLDYRKDFHPFAEESEQALELVLGAAVQDLYAGVFHDQQCVAFYMLRGWDAGYERPSFGLLVDHDFASKGLGYLCLRAALAECRLRGCPACMLKVAPDNVRAKEIYLRAGFHQEGICPKTGHEMFSISLS